MQKPRSQNGFRLWGFVVMLRGGANHAVAVAAVAKVALVDKLYAQVAVLMNTERETYANGVTMAGTSQVILSTA